MEYPHDIILQAWTDTNKFTREQLLETVDNTAKDLPLMFITIYNRANPNFKELISRHWAYLGRSSATRDFEQRKFMVTYRRPPSLKDQLIGARITQPTHPATQGCKDQIHASTARKSGKIKNTLNNKNYNTMRNGTCQSNNLIYCIECNWCQTKYVGQTRNRIIDRFQGHIFDIKHNNNTTVARHFGSHKDHIDPNMITHILEYIRLPRDLPRSNSLRDSRELVWIHRLNI